MPLPCTLCISLAHLTSCQPPPYEKSRLLCEHTGCHTLQELTDDRSSESQPRQCPIARLVRVYGQVDIPVKLPHSLSLGLSERETS